MCRYRISYMITVYCRLKYSFIKLYVLPHRKCRQSIGISILLISLHPLDPLLFYRVLPPKLRHSTGVHRILGSHEDVLSAAERPFRSKVPFCSPLLFNSIFLSRARIEIIVQSFPLTLFFLLPLFPGASCLPPICKASSKGNIHWTV